jgi:hypothetical protein
MKHQLPEVHGCAADAKTAARAAARAAPAEKASKQKTAVLRKELQDKIAQQQSDRRKTAKDEGAGAKRKG